MQQAAGKQPTDLTAKMATALAEHFMKQQNPAFQNITDDNAIAIEWFRAATEDWAQLDDDVKKQWQAKANKADSTGFFEWAKSQLQVGE